MSKIDLVFHPLALQMPDRSKIKNHLPAVIWFTGYSGSGKSTLANLLEKQLNQQFHAHTYLLDGDNIRLGLNRDLGFSVEDRQENIRRVSEVAHLFYDAGLIVLTAFISPFRIDRENARRIIGDGFVEVYIDCSLEVCEQRDPKGLYKKARKGEIIEFTGISSPYEPPENPEITIHTTTSNPMNCIVKITSYLKAQKILLVDYD